MRSSRPLSAVLNDSETAAVRSQAGLTIAPGEKESIG